MWCVCTTTTAVTSTTTSGSLTPAADSHGNRPCLLSALAGAEKRPQIACRRRPANGGHLCVNIDHSRGTSSSKGCPWSQLRLLCVLSRRKGWKFLGGSSNVEGITCSPLLGIWLTDLPKKILGGRNFSPPFPHGSAGPDVKASEKESERAWPI